jgi:protein-S-isoprenylcysteine O-methyltransferase Ste14
VSDDGRGQAMLRHLRAFVLPVAAVVIIPFLLVIKFTPFSIEYYELILPMQIALGLVLFSLGLFLMVVTVRIFILKGNGTLAPWDPTKRLVVCGIYQYTRNPMITGVALMLLGESAFFANWLLLAWFGTFVAANTVYFKLFEEPGLEKRFGNEYFGYRKNVPMWIPRRRPRSLTSGSLRDDKKS